MDFRYDGAMYLRGQLTKAQSDYLYSFSARSHLRHDENYLGKDPLREAVGLPLGVQGAYFTGTFIDRGGPQYDEVVVGQPSEWCDIEYHKDLNALVWDGTSGGGYIRQWLEYIRDHFLNLWGYQIDGALYWRDNEKDFGTIRCEEGIFSVHPGETIYYERKKGYGPVDRSALPNVAYSSNFPEVLLDTYRALKERYLIEEYRMAIEGVSKEEFYRKTKMYVNLLGEPE